MNFRGEVGLDECRAQQVARLFVLQQLVKRLIQPCAKHQLAQLLQAIGAPFGGEHRFLPRLRQQMPEAFAVQVKKGHGDVAALAGRVDSLPVQAKQLHQLIIQLNEVAANVALGKQVDDREKQEGFMRGAVGSNGRPVGTAFVNA